MPKKYIVRLTDAEWQTLGEVVAKLKGSSQKVRRAQVLLKADADGPCWTDAEIADAFGCRTKTVENIRERFVTEGFEVTLEGKPRAEPRTGTMTAASPGPSSLAPTKGLTAVRPCTSWSYWRTIHSLLQTSQ